MAAGRDDEKGMKGARERSIRGEVRMREVEEMGRKGVGGEDDALQTLRSSASYAFGHPTSNIGRTD